MMRRIRRLARYAACVLALWSSVGLAQVSSGVFHKVGAVEAQLTRGASTKSDVQTLLGVPNGTGASLLPSTAGGKNQAWQQREVWYYGDIESDAALGSAVEGVVPVDVRIQMLLVFFKGGVFDGYLWTSNTNVPPGR